MATPDGIGYSTENHNDSRDQGDKSTIRTQMACSLGRYGPQSAMPVRNPLNPREPANKEPPFPPPPQSPQPFKADVSRVVISLFQGPIALEVIPTPDDVHEPFRNK